MTIKQGMRRGSTVISRALAGLRCNLLSVGCVRHFDDTAENQESNADLESSIRWLEWAERNLPTLLDSAESPLDFCRLVHDLFLENSDNCQFMNWKWDFLSSLFDKAPCNCVCGTLLILSAAEYVGLFPRYIHELANDSHIWITACHLTFDQLDAMTPSKLTSTLAPDSSHRGRTPFSIFETTLRPCDSNRILTEKQAAQIDTYNYGMWSARLTPAALLQECFVNEYVTAKTTAEKKRQRAILKQISERLQPRSRILDVQQLWLRQKMSERNNVKKRSGEIVSELHIMWSNLRSSSEVWGIEVHMRNIAFLVRLLSFISLSVYVHDQYDVDENSFQKDGNDSSHWKSQVETLWSEILGVVNELRITLKNGDWSLRSETIKRDWLEIKDHCQRYKKWKL